MLLEFLGETLWIYGVVAVDKLIFHHGARKTVEYGAAHGEFIEVGVGEVGDNRFHIVMWFFMMLQRYTIFLY